MTPVQSPGVSPIATVPPGWLGGFEQSNPLYPYPSPDLSPIAFTGNMDNIAKLTRARRE